MRDVYKRLQKLDGDDLAVSTAVLLSAAAPLAALVAGTPPIAALIGGVTLGALALMARRIGTAIAPFIIATCLMGQAMLFTAAFAGHPWQIDSHMLFFVLLAVGSTMQRLPVVIWACAITALHHLGLTVLLPKLVYPSLDLMENLMRTALHAGVVVLEGAVLMIAIAQRTKATAAAARSTARLATESRMAADAKEEADDARQAAIDVISAFRVGLTQLADRNLTCQIDQPLPARYEELRSDFNTAISTLRRAFAEAEDLAGEISSGSQALAGSIQSMSADTRNRASALSDVNLTAVALLDALARTAEQAGVAACSAREARESAMRGGEVTQTAIEAMRGIEQSSNKISRIVDMIDDVSFQTNLLALNAGVEAARAGESGKGFAVVASEVRQLAKSTSEAANGIKKLISDSSDQVSHGAELVNAVGQRLEDIVSQISRTNDMTKTISEQNGEQVESLNRLGGMVREVDQQTQRSAALAEELSAQSKRMTVASCKLSADMAAFTLSEDDRHEKNRAVS